VSRVLVLGNAGVDLSLRVPRLPRPGETLMAGSLARAPGGKGLNQAVTAARAGAETWFLAPVGCDADGRFIAESLAAEGFASLRLVTVPRAATDLSVILVGADAENCIVTAGPCADALDEASAAEFASGAEAGDVVLLQGNLSLSATLAAARAAAGRAARVLLNPAPLRWTAAPVLTHCAAVVANQGEAAEITGHADPRDAAAKLRAMGPALAMVTLGAAGCVRADATGVRALPAAPVQAVDTTGAGDTFCGVLAACLARGWPVSDGLAAAQRAAAITASRPGAYAALPRRDELADVGLSVREGSGAQG
jgi:ribokinase